MRHRESRTTVQPAISDDNAPVLPAHRPTRWTVRRVRSIAYVLVGLAVAASLVSVYLTYRAAEGSAAQAGAADRRLALLEEDLAERTEQRNAERDAAAARDAATRAELSTLLCELLGQLPADSPNLDRIRETLACTQPGVPGVASPSSAGTPPDIPPTSGTSSRPTGPVPGGTATTPPPQTATPPAAPPPPSPPPSLLCNVLPVVC